LLVDVVDLARSTNDELGEALTLTTLGSLMTRIGGHDRLKQAERALRRSVQLRGGMVGDDDGLALSALGAVLLRQGSPEQLLEAERLFRRSLSLLPQEQQSVARDRLALVLARLGGPGRLREAETLLRERADEVTRDLDRAVVLNTLAQVLLKRGDPDALKEANDLVIQSIELGRASRNPRHVAIALLTASKIAEQRGELDLAVRRHEELIRTNRSLGLSREVQAGEDYLHDLKRRRDSQAP
jgi:tetratricopeptide (TPR) repeat protein